MEVPRVHPREVRAERSDGERRRYRAAVVGRIRVRHVAANAGRIHDRVRTSIRCGHSVGRRYRRAGDAGEPTFALAFWLPCTDRAVRDQDSLQ